MSVAGLRRAGAIPPLHAAALRCRFPIGKGGACGGGITPIGANTGLVPPSPSPTGRGLVLSVQADLYLRAHRIAPALRGLVEE